MHTYMYIYICIYIYIYLHCIDESLCSLSLAGFRNAVVMDLPQGICLTAITAVEEEDKAG